MLHGSSPVGGAKRETSPNGLVFLLVSTAGTHGRCISKCEAFTTLYGNGCRRRCERPKAIGTWFEVRRGAKKNSSTKWGCSFLFTQADSEAGAYSFREKTIRFTVEAVVGDVVTQKRLALGSR